MDDRRQVLRRVGIVLCVVGACDVALMIWCIAQGQSYSSSLNMFAVTAGFFLIRGSERAVRIVRWFSAYYIAALGSAALVIPFMFPMELWILTIRLYPGATFISVFILLTVFGLIAWAYWQLRTEPVLLPSSNSGRRIGPPRLAFALGAALVIGVAGSVHCLLNDDTARKAVLLAKERYGEDYRYFVSSVRWSGNRAQVRLTAYNAHEMRPVQIEWEQD